MGLGMMLVGALALTVGVVLAAMLARKHARYMDAVGRARGEALAWLARFEEGARAIDDTIARAEQTEQRLRQEWFSARGPAPVDALMEVKGIGEGTVELLRRHGVRALDETRDGGALERISGIGPAKASLILAGRAQAADAWQRKLEAEYAEVFSTSHRETIRLALGEAERARARRELVAELVRWAEARKPEVQRASFSAFVLRGHAPQLGELVAQLESRHITFARLLAHDQDARAQEIRPPAELAREAALRAHGGDLRAATLELLRDRYDWRAFELFVGELWRRMGYTVEVTVGSGDSGVDVIARDATSCHYIQVKRYSATTAVGNDVILKIAAHMLHEATHAAVVTTGRFTRAARDEAARFDVRLIGPDALLDLMETHGLEPDWTERGSVEAHAQDR